MSTLSQFMPGGIKKIQRGTATDGIVSISTVNLQKSMITSSCDSGSTTYVVGTQTHHFATTAYAALVGASSIQISGGGTVAWQVVEFY